MRDLFEVQRYPEGPPPYDVSGWTLPLLFGVHRVAVIEELAGYESLRREVRYGENSRIDLFLSDPDRPDCYVEVKSTTYTQGRTACFPDAVTERGRKHLVELTKMAKKGHRAVQFFLVSRNDVDVLRPADEIDPVYGKELRKAVDAGVEAIAWKTNVRARSFELKEPIPVEL